MCGRRPGKHFLKDAEDAVKAEADRFAANVLPIVREAQKAGARTLRELADWYAQTVANVLARA